MLGTQRGAWRVGAKERLHESTRAVRLLYIGAMCGLESPNRESKIEESVMQNNNALD